MYYMMSENICKFCNTNFKNKYSLNTHIKTAKFCLEIQNKNSEVTYNCDYCSKIFNRKDLLDTHLKKCKVNDKIQKEELINQINILNKKNEKLKNTINTNNITIKDLEKYKKLYDDLLVNFNKQQQMIENLASKAIENAGNKTYNNNKNQIYNSLQPLTDDYMREQAKFLTYNNVKNGAHGIAHFASNHTFKDRLFCSDKSRLNFVFKLGPGPNKSDADTIIKDPEGVEITKRFIEINREEIVRLVEEYLLYITNELMDDSTSKEMYELWAQKREEFLAIKSAVLKGNVADNKESYAEFKKNFLLALSNLVPR